MCMASLCHTCNTCFCVLTLFNMLNVCIIPYRMCRIFLYITLENKCKLSTLTVVGNVRTIDAHLWYFLILLVLHIIYDPIDSFFLQKKVYFSLSHSVPETLGSKVWLIFYQNVSLIDLKHFISYPWFSIQFTSFS